MHIESYTVNIQQPFIGFSDICKGAKSYNVEPLTSHYRDHIEGLKSMVGWYKAMDVGHKPAKLKRRYY